jgi:hypothetical protein
VHHDARHAARGAQATFGSIIAATMLGRVERAARTPR